MSDELLLQKKFEEDTAWMQKNMPPVILKLDFVSAWSLFSNIQLALSHPQNNGPSSIILREIATQLEESICKTKTCQILAAQGWERVPQPANGNG